MKTVIIKNTYGIKRKGRIYEKNIKKLDNEAESLCLSRSKQLQAYDNNSVYHGSSGRKDRRITLTLIRKKQANLHSNSETNLLLSMQEIHQTFYG